MNENKNQMDNQEQTERKDLVQSKKYITKNVFY